MPGLIRHPVRQMPRNANGTIGRHRTFSARKEHEFTLIGDPTMRGNKLLLSMAAVAALALAGCGTNPGDRAVSGAMIGAAGGAIIGGAAGNPALGAAAGAVAGGVVGAATDPCDLNLGDPVWSNDRGAYERRCGRPYRGR